MRTGCVPDFVPRFRTVPRAVPLIAPIVFVVDDDDSVRESLRALIEAGGWRPEVFASAREFLSHPRAAEPACLILDVTLPDLNGLELQQRLADQADLPIIFVTGYGDIPMSVRAMKAGAVEFLTKPFSAELLLGAIHDAIARSRALLEQHAIVQEVRAQGITIDTGDVKILFAPGASLPPRVRMEARVVREHPHREGSVRQCRRRAMWLARRPRQGPPPLLRRSYRLLQGSPRTVSPPPARNPWPKPCP